MPTKTFLPNKVNQFVTSAHFLLPLKISENVMVFACNVTAYPFVPNAHFLYHLKCFPGIQKGCIGNEWINLFRANDSFILMFPDIILQNHYSYFFGFQPLQNNAIPIC